MLCKLFNLYQNSIREEVDNIIRSNNSYLCDDRLLQLLATKVNIDYLKIQNNKSLRYIISSFKTIIRNKGSYTGIKYCVELFLRCYNIYSDYSIVLPVWLDQYSLGVETLCEDETLCTDDTICGYTKQSFNEDDFLIRIFFDRKVPNLNLLEELLTYVLPFGFIVSIGQYNEFNIIDSETGKDTEIYRMNYKYEGLFTNSIETSKISNNFNLENKLGMKLNYAPTIENTYLFNSSEIDDKEEIIKNE